VAVREGKNILATVLLDQEVVESLFDVFFLPTWREKGSQLFLVEGHSRVNFRGKT
jgi:hypothetical protein